MADSEYKVYLMRAKKQAFWMCKTYDYHKAEYERILHESSKPSDIPVSSSLPGDPAGRKAVELAPHGEIIHPIEYAIKTIPAEYRKAVWDHCVKGEKGYPSYADRKTYYSYQNKFLLEILRYKHLI